MKHALFVLLALLAFSAYGEEIEDIPDTVRKTLRTELRASLLTEVDVAKIDIQPVPASPGYYQAVVGGYRFMIEDGGFVLRTYYLNAGEGRRLTQSARKAMRREALAALDPDSTIIFPPAGDVRHTLTVFTDVHCPFCTRFHREALPLLLRAGVEVRYLAYPSLGPGSPDAMDTAAVWCHSNRPAALNAALHGFPVFAPPCEHPVEAHHTLGESLGVRGTPTLIFENGEIRNGYRHPEMLLRQIQGTRFTP